MRFTVKTVYFYLVITTFTAGLFANDGVKREHLPAHKQAELGPAGHDIVPGYVEQKPINDVIKSGVLNVNNNHAQATLQTTVTRVQSALNGPQNEEMDDKESDIQQILSKYKNNQSLTEQQQSILNHY